MGRLALRILILGVLLPALALELLLHVSPGWLPSDYRDLFPAHGLEFFHPGVLSRTPVEGLPIPLVPMEWVGPPPADLKEIGIAPLEEDSDALRFPSVRIPSDARGLPNPTALERAATVLVGDSFLVSASYREPGGLFDVLESAGAGPLYSLGVSGIGPLREAWLLEHVGLPLSPRLVIWFFFGGNDLSDAKVILERRAAGFTVHADLPSYRPVPEFRLLDLARWWMDRSSSSPPPNFPSGDPALPPMGLQRTDGGAPEPIWFHPSHLARASLSRADWELHLAWPATREAILAAREQSRTAGARFVLVYLPSKVEANLPYVERDTELLRRHLSHGLEAPLQDVDPFPRLLAQRRAMGELLESFCLDAGIPFFSATPVLEQLASTGRSGYLATDTHWSLRGVEAMAGPLVEFLEQHELLPR